MQPYCSSLEVSGLVCLDILAYVFLPVLPSMQMCACLHICLMNVWAYVKGPFVCVYENETHKHMNVCCSKCTFHHENIYVFFGV